MKLLFISSNPVHSKTNGGEQCTNRNYLSLCELLGNENIEVIQTVLKAERTLKGLTNRVLNYLSGFNAGLSNSVINDIVTASKRNDIVFIDSSQDGIISYYLRKHKFKGSVICFFHNVEYKIILQKVKANPLKIWKLLIEFYNERSGLKYSDKLACLCTRDVNELKSVYKESNLSNAHIIPISFADRYSPNSPSQTELTATVPTCLFIGNYWYANIHGLNWFVNNVLEEVNIKLQIVGSGMDVLRDEYVNPKIEFLGFVENLSSVIEAADFIIAPIFKGGGMKVKICEAMMYGKNIIGTPEAFNGYEVDYAKAGAVCESKEQFIAAFNEISLHPRPKFNLYNRTCFLTKYSYQATLAQFKSLIYN